MRLLVMPSMIPDTSVLSFHQVVHPFREFPPDLSFIDILSNISINLTICMHSFVDYIPIYGLA